jgi:uncharacterized protein (DUF849 family)
VTADDLARDVAAVATAGANAVHLHVKDGDGLDTLDGAAMASALVAVRAAAPSLPLGVTTGAWMLPDASARVATIRSWQGLGALPDFASVNWHEGGADEVAAARLLELVREAGSTAGEISVLLHGEGASTWPALQLAGRLASATRIGLEDVLTLPSGSVAADNATLVRAARELSSRPT